MYILRLSQNLQNNSFPDGIIKRWIPAIAIFSLIISFFVNVLRLFSITISDTRISVDFYLSGH